MVRRGRPPLKSIFITGFPNFISSYLIKYLLLNNPNITISLLVQPKFKKRAQQFIHSINATDKHVHIYEGDVTALDLGLSGDEYNNLIEQVTHVYHLAAISYPCASKETMFHVNVHGTRNTLEFSAACKKLKRFIHFSSCFVSGKRQGVILENELDMNQPFRNQYEYTKYLAEKEVHQYIPTVPISIIRSPIVVGDSQTGEIARFDGLYYMAIMMAFSPVPLPIMLPGKANAPLNIIPVDYLIKASIKIASSKNAVGKTFHVVDPNPLSSRRVFEIVASRTGKKLSTISFDSRIISSLFKLPLLPRWTRIPKESVDYLNTNASYNYNNTFELLDGSGIQCPRFENYADTLITFVKDYYKNQKIERLQPKEQSLM